MCRYMTDEARVSRIGVATRTSSLEALVDADLDTLVTALYVKIDDGLLKDRRPGHPARLSQSELVSLAVVQALLGFHSEHRWIRYALCHLRGAFPYLPHQPGCSEISTLPRRSAGVHESCSSCLLRAGDPASASLARAGTRPVCRQAKRLKSRLPTARHAASRPAVSPRAGCHSRA
jgi:hypothetical protein